MQATEIICVVSGRKKIYYSAVKIAAEYIDGAGAVEGTEGAVPDGPVEEFCAAQLKSFTRSSGLLEGACRVYDPATGALLREENYSQGALDGPRRVYFENGRLRSEETYKNGKLAGEAREYYPSGSIRMIDSYEDCVFSGRKEFADILDAPPLSAHSKTAPLAAAATAKSGLRAVSGGSPAGAAAKRETVKAPPPGLSAPAAGPAGQVPPSGAQPEEEKGVVRKVSDNTRVYVRGGDELAREILGRGGEVTEIIGAIPDGPVSEFYRSGKLKFSETYRDGRLNGPRKKYDELGRLWAEETYVDGKLDGLVKIHNYFKDKVFDEEASFKNNKLDGTRKTCYPNGNISVEENYRDGKLSGLRRSFYENGQVNSEENYADDRLSGPRRRYYDNGKLWNEENYADGRLEGARKDYYPTGVPRLQENYKTGRLSGERKFYYDNGHLMYEETYLEGKLQRRTEYKSKGPGAV
ncbi:MAG: hypothetical protein PHP45_03680 [Elusimicrobiales bacterium]|nr:hypothetical protein [Elusimicrobiales bacterium]